MALFTRFKQMFSTGQASLVYEAERLYETGDLAGAVTLLEQTLASRAASGKLLDVVTERLDKYSQELREKEIHTYRSELAETAFEPSHFERLKEIFIALNHGIKNGLYTGENRQAAESLFKEYIPSYKTLQTTIKKHEREKITRVLTTLHPENDADLFVTKMEELRRQGGAFPETLRSAYEVAQKRSYRVQDTIKEFDGYLISGHGPIGRGGFAAVFLAKPAGIDVRVAIKIFAPQPSLVTESGMSIGELKERFRREANIMLRLSQERIPGIVFARDFKTWQGKPYLTMDYYPKSLSAWIGSDEDLLRNIQGKNLSFDRAMPLIHDILTTVRALHNRANPIIHRDLKPTNILLDKENRPHIGDFGLAKEFSKVHLLTKTFKTTMGTQMATQYYGAPEQQTDLKETDQRADIYSLGVLIYRILTGRLLGFHDLEPIDRYVDGVDSELATRIDDILSKATRVEVDQRLADVSTMLEVFAPQEGISVDVKKNAPVVQQAEETFRTMLETAYEFASDGVLATEFRAKLMAKAEALGLHTETAVLLDKEVAARFAPSDGTEGRSVSLTGSRGLSTEETGILIVTSEPEMATVLIDGMERGQTPLTVSRIGVGNRKVLLRKPAYFPASRIERIVSGEEKKIHIILEPQTGIIYVSAITFSNAYPANFYLDDRIIGRTPLKVEDVISGTHTYRFEADNHQEISGEVIVTLDEEIRLEKNLPPLPGRIAVQSKPTGAAIWLDGRATDQKTDAELKVEAGDRTVKLTLEGYLDAEKKLQVLPGQALKEHISLSKNTGKFHLISVPQGATIMVDGQNTGQKTDAILQLRVGNHEVVLKKEGYQELSKKVHIGSGGYDEEVFRLKKSVTQTPQIKKSTTQAFQTLEHGKIWTEPFTEMAFIFVPPGIFQMGDLFGDGSDDEKPVHEVELDGFWIGKYPVTQGQWQKVMGNNPSHFKKGDNHPVEKVSWGDTQAFLEKLNTRNSDSFRLPTEAEWEYACRSGGKKEKYAGGDDVDRVAWYDENSGESTHPVGTKAPNGLGIYDMSGNVWEWVQDIYAENTYSKHARRNPIYEGSGSYRVYRGGSWDSDAGYLRSAYRYRDPPGRRLSYIGFRVVSAPPGT